MAKVYLRPGQRISAVCELEIGGGCGQAAFDRIDIEAQVQYWDEDRKLWFKVMDDRDPESMADLNRMYINDAEGTALPSAWIPAHSQE